MSGAHGCDADYGRVECHIKELQATSVDSSSQPLLHAGGNPSLLLGQSKTDFRLRAPRVRRDLSATGSVQQHKIDRAIRLETPAVYVSRRCCHTPSIYVELSHDPSKIALDANHCAACRAAVATQAMAARL